MQSGMNGAVSFLGCFSVQKKREDGILGRCVYWKPTHNNLYLNGKSHNFPAHKGAVLSTLLHQAITILDEQHLQEELDIIRLMVFRNGYNEQEIELAKQKSAGSEMTVKEEEEIRRTILILFCGTAAGRIAHLLRKAKIVLIFKPPCKLGQFMTL